jgi:hypothetical protein
MWIYHPFRPAEPWSTRCMHGVGSDQASVHCGRTVDHPVHQPPTETTTPAEVRTGISDRAAAALADVAELRNAIVGSEASGSDVTHMLRRLDRIEQALRADGGA